MYSWKITSRGWAMASILTLGGLMLPNSALAEDWCGTRILPEHVPIVRERMAAGIYDPLLEMGSPLYVPVTFHVVRRSNGTGGLGQARLVRALDDANLAFANSGIRFCWIGPTDYIDSDDFYFFIDTDDEIDALRGTNRVANTLNIYFTPNLANEDGRLCGISSFTFSDVQGIVMANGCTATSDDHSTFPHEIGHYFDLFHTHTKKFGPECPDCREEKCACSVAGDLLCDTPADPKLGANNVDNNCNYIGNERDPCSNSRYNPDPSNFMSYAPPRCQNRFSNQQNFRGQATLVRLRPDLINDDCPGDNQWNLDGKLTASDGAATDNFGYSVALSADTALVGAPFDDDRGSESGSAYIFQKINGIWGQVAKLIPRDGATGDWFGRSVALSADTALVGAPFDDDRGSESGSAYIFEKPGGVWKQVAKLSAADGATGDWFGRSVALSGDTALVGAYRDDDRGTDSGSAYIFEKTGGVWRQASKLTAADGAEGDWFGRSVALLGNTALVGAALDNDRGSDSGSAYIFENTGGVWKQMAKLTAPDGAEDDLFGLAVALSSDTALVGALWDDDRGGNSGSAYIFEKTEGAWKQAAKLTAADGAAGDWFGHSVSLSSDTALVGARYDDDRGKDSGSAYVFEKIGGVWKQVAKLTAADGAEDDSFGYSVVLSGDTALVGALWDDDRGIDSGSAYVFADLNALRQQCDPCDANCDGSVDLTDVEPFIELLLGGGQPCADCTGDANSDGSVDLSDVEPFIKCLLG